MRVLRHAHDRVPDERFVDLGAFESPGDGFAAKLGRAHGREETRLAIIDENVGARRSLAAVEDDD